MTLLAELVYPRSCVLCERPLSPEWRDWCPTCAAEILDATAFPFCPRCGATAEPYRIDQEGCPSCRSTPTPLDGICRVGRYEGPISELIRRYKFHGLRRIDRLLGVMLAQAIRGQPWSDRIDALVPVPASLVERWKYRFFPVGQLAGSASKELCIPALPLLTVRGKKHRQVEIAPSDRPANVRGKYYLRSRACVAGARLCIIDDVSTTGSTLHECARVLRRAGAEAVFAAVLARAGPRSAAQRS